MTSLSLVLPCFNEAQNIEKTVQNVAVWFAKEQMDGEIIIVNDGSRDNTLEVAKKLQKSMPGIKVVNHEKNQGYGAAIRSGCDVAEKEIVGFMDSDGQFHAEDIGILLPHLTDVNFVSGIRGKRADPLIRKIKGRVYNTLIQLALSTRIKDVNCGMKIFKRSIWKTIRPAIATGALINAELYLALKNANMPWKEIPVPHYPRTAGTQTGGNFAVMMKMFKELFHLKKTRKEFDIKRAAMEAM